MHDINVYKIKINNEKVNNMNKNGSKIIKM